MLSDVTALIKTYQRPQYIKQCISTLKSTYPSINIIVADSQLESKEEELKALGADKYIHIPSNHDVPYGRNILIDACQTRYFLLADDDFSFDVNSRIPDLLSLMDIYDIAGTAIMCDNEIQHFEYNFDQNESGVIKGANLGGAFEPIQPNYQVQNGIQFQLCNLTFNSFLGKTKQAQTIRWDENIHVSHEHEDFFLSCFRAGLKVVYCPNSIVKHKIGNYPDCWDFAFQRGYKKHEDRAYVVQKWGLI
jgi:GT2 family glycosyltransferase